MEMIERYIYAVTKKLPKEQREDTEHELRGLIYDMLDKEYNGQSATDEDVKAVLKSLGHPNKLALRYRTDERYIIGPEIYHSYILILKIALITAISIMSVTFVVQTILNPFNVLHYFIEFIISLFTTVIPMAVGWTTVSFFIIEYFNPRKLEHLLYKENWNPDKLPSIPSTTNQIKRSDTIIALIVHIAIITFLTFSQQYFGVWVFEEGQFIYTVPFLNQQTLSIILPLLIVLFSLNILKELTKLIYEKWTYLLMTVVSIVNIASIIILFTIKDRLWNQSFISELVDYKIISKSTSNYETVTIIWEQLTFWIIVLSIVGLLIDIVLSFIKVRKYKD